MYHGFMEYDVEVNGSLGFYTFRPLTDEGRKFIEDHVQLEDWQSESNFGVDDSRMAEAIAVGMLKDGLNVLYNGLPASLKDNAVFVPA